MGDSGDSKIKSITALQSAAEETAMKRAVQRWENEGGHMSSTGGRVVQRIGEPRPFVAILSHEGAGSTEHPFATMREAEAFIKRNTPVPRRTLSPLYDRPAGG